MAKEFYLVSIYMNEEFIENYFKPFLQMVTKDLKICPKQKEGEGKESASQCIRALIKKYVDFKKKKLLEKSKQ